MVICYTTARAMPAKYPERRRSHEQEKILPRLRQQSEPQADPTPALDVPKENAVTVTVQIGDDNYSGTLTKV